jgi:hypothetical protein
MQRREDNSKMDLTGIGWGQHKSDSPGFRQGATDKLLCTF